MNKVATSGVIIYSHNLESLSEFYIKMFDMVKAHQTNDFISLKNNDFNIVVHKPPIKIPDGLFNTVKIFLTVRSHEEAKTKAVALGGKALEGVWQNPIFKVCNIADPEGNHIQIREFFK